MSNLTNWEMMERFRNDGSCEKMLLDLLDSRDELAKAADALSEALEKASCKCTSYPWVKCDRCAALAQWKALKGKS